MGLVIMIVVKLAGGLGNQMFQYAAGRYLSEKHQTALKLDLVFLLDRTPRMNFIYRDYALNLFNAKVDFASNDEVVHFGRLRRLGRLVYGVRSKLNPNLPVYVRETPYHFDPTFFSIPNQAYIEGYWQSEDYFKPIEHLIRKEFTFRDDFDAHGREMAGRIAQVNGVCMNVRRGDFVSNPVAAQHHGVCDTDYFMRAAGVIAERVEDPHFFVFSDDVDWCRDNICLKCPLTIVDHEYAGRKFGQYLQLMIMCKHFIISNSSYAWWAAWLSECPDKVVIAPCRWYRNPRMDTSHLIPHTWLRV